MFPNPRFHMICRDELQRCILASAHNVLSVMADIVLEECHEGMCSKAHNGVTALIGFGGTYSGLVALHCPEPLAQRIATGMLCTEGVVEMQELFDAMGEVVNILGGDMKLFLDRGGRQVQLTTPSVFMGNREFRDKFLSNAETVTCAMSSGSERLLIGVQVSRGE